MPADIVSSMFGPTPYQIQQQQNQALEAAANRFAEQTPLQRAAAAIYKGGGMLGGAVGEAMGLENPAIREANERNMAMSGIDLSNPQSILERANTIQNPRLRMQLQMLAQQKVAEQQKVALEAKKSALAERKQDFTEQEAFALKKQQAEQAYELAKQRADDYRSTAQDRAAAAREANQIRLQIAQMSADARRDAAAMQREKPISAFQRTKLLQDANAEKAELSSVENAFSDIRAKAKELTEHPGLPAATGIVGAFKSIPGGDAAKAEGLLAEFKASVKKQGLEMAREGGSIGQMTEKEWPMVEAMIANIDPVKMGLQGTKDQISKAVKYAESLVKRARNKYQGSISALPSELQPQIASQQPEPTPVAPVTPQASGGWKIRPKGGQ